MTTAPIGVVKQRFDIGLEDLQTFLTVAEVGSFSRAAERMSLSQPSISNRVRRLEEKLRVRLLDRTTRSVKLTTPGRRLYLEASETLRGLYALLREFDSEAASRGRQVTIGATMMVASVALPPILRAFQESNPAITLKLHDLSPGEALEQVADGRCDLAVMAQVGPRSGIGFETLLIDRCVVVTPLKHPLLERQTATLAEVLAFPLLSPDGHVGLRRAITAEADRMDLAIRLSPQGRDVNNVMTLLAMAAAGLGVCIHPTSLIPPELGPTIGVVPLSDCDIVRTFGVVTAEGRPISPPARRFLEFLRATVGGKEAVWTGGRNVSAGQAPV